MNNYKTVLNRLYKTKKTELKSDKIELSVTTDLKAIFEKVQSIYKKADQRANDVEKRFLAVNKENKKAKAEIDAIRKKAQKIAFDAGRKAKELGIKPPKEWYDTYDKIAKLNVPVSNSANIFPL